jgi:hypothetical protein
LQDLRKRVSANGLKSHQFKSLSCAINAINTINCKDHHKMDSKKDLQLENVVKNLKISSKFKKAQNFFKSSSKIIEKLDIFQKYHLKLSNYQSSSNFHVFINDSTIHQ